MTIIKKVQKDGTLLLQCIITFKTLEELNKEEAFGSFYDVSYRQIKER
jgi:hypothetical protein